MVDYYHSFKKHQADRDQQILDWLSEGKKAVDISKLLGVSRQRSYQLIKRVTK